MSDVAYLECFAAQEAVYWEARRQNMGLSDKNVGDLLRVAAPLLVEDENKTIVALQHARRKDTHKMFDDVAAACGYEGKDWDACMAHVRELAKGQDVVNAAKDLIADGHQTPIPLAPHQGVLWANLERALASYENKA